MNSFLILLIIYATYKVYLKVKHLYLSKKWGCQPVFYIKYESLGFGFFKEQNQLLKSGYLLEKQLAKFKSLGKHTIAFKVLGRTTIVTCNGENIKTMIGPQFSNFSIGVREHALQPLIGHGIFSSEGDSWKASRDMLRPQFSREQIAHIQSLEPHFQNFASLIEDIKTFDLQSLFHRLTIDASSEFLFGESTHTLVTDASNKFAFANDFGSVQETLTKRILCGPLYWIVNPKSFRQAVARTHKAVRYYVDKALNTPSEELNKKSKDGYIFLYQLVQKTRDPKILQDELLSILLAGRNTTAALLSFLFFELSRNPEIWEKLKSEVYNQFGDGEHVQFDDISFETMKRCTYLKYCINEALRMYPPVARNLRMAKNDTYLPRGGGDGCESPLLIPKGTNVAFILYATHRDPEVYGEDVDTFRPERWDHLKPGWSFMPFGSGPRICLGQQFALTEASYITIRTLQTFPTIFPTSREYPPEKETNATMRLRGGLKISLSRV